MSAKTKTEAKVAVLKGQEAEDKILEYLKRMNRPYGAVDVAANLKGAVPKATTQKILVALAEKGELVQKIYGKTTFFVANQANIDSMLPDKVAELEAEYKSIEDENKMLAAELRSYSSELTKLKSNLTDAELETKVAEVTAAIASTSARVEPLKSGAQPISAADLALVDAEWTKWRAEWIKRRKVFTAFWQLATDYLPPQDAASLAEDLGIEVDTTEHNALEITSLCLAHKPLNSLGKRKRL
ncbi:TBPIP-domain-containing protein [Tricholoma matsutake]|nr:TBPIP-domain-containing protein [Tricholoma matsutake 945]